MRKELSNLICIFEQLRLIHVLVLGALDSMAVLACDARPLWLEVIVNVDLRVGTMPVGAWKEVLAESQRLAPDIVLLVLQFLYDLCSNFVSKLLDVSEVSVDIFEFLLYQRIFHDLPLHSLDKLISGLGLSKASPYVLRISHFVTLVGARAVSKALGSS